MRYWPTNNLIHWGRPNKKVMLERLNKFLGVQYLRAVYQGQYKKAHAILALGVG